MHLDRAHNRRRPDVRGHTGAWISLATGAAQVGVSQLRFADADDGFAFGPDLFVTHDAGATWHQVDVGGAVDDLAIADGEVYAVITPAGNQLAQSRLLRSPISRDQWGVLSAAGDVARGLWVHGSDVLIESNDNGKLLASHDFGASFNRYPVPSPGLPCQFQEMAPSVLWEHCATGMMSNVWRSLDGGATFQPAQCRRLRPAWQRSAAPAAELGDVRRGLGDEQRLSATSSSTRPLMVAATGRPSVQRG